jgi:hypothetical protein
MLRQPESLQRVTYVDFLTAIVIGSAIQFMAPLSVSFKFFALLFLSFVMLEDFWIYHTHIAKHDVRDQESFSILVIQWAIPLSWYLTVITVPDSPRAGLFSFGLFYFFKWLGGFTHYRHVQQISDPLSHRIWTFLVPMVTCFFLCFRFPTLVLAHPGTWGPVLCAVVFQISVYWWVTSTFSAADPAA